MRAGALDDRVQFRRLTLSDDGLQRVGELTDHGAPVPADKEDISDGERWRAGEVQAHVTTRFTVRSSAFTRAITPKDVLVCGGRTYDIVGIKDSKRRRRHLEMTAAARIDT